MGSKASRGGGRSAPWRIVIVDDHPDFRQAIKDILSEYSVEDLEVVGEAEDGKEAVEVCRRLHPDLVLMDIKMPGMDGFEATQEIKREFPRTHVLMLTAMEDPEHLAEALRVGAAGYVLKDLTSERILGAIRRVLEGEAPLNQELALLLLRRLLEKTSKGQGPTVPSASFAIASEERSRPPVLELLTEREVEVLRLLTQGQSNQEIARSLSVSKSTIKKHMGQIILKLGVSNRLQAGIRAIELGLGPKQ